MSFDDKITQKNHSAAASINKWYRADEALVIKELLAEIDLPEHFYDKVQTRTLKLIRKIREQPEEGSYVAQLMQQFKLSSPQGLTLMAMAESLLRIPDTQTADKLIQEKLTQGDWSNFVNIEKNSLLKLSKLALLTSQRVLEESHTGNIGGFIKKTITKAGAPVIRQSVKQMMMQLADEFILGNTMDKALTRAQEYEKKSYRYSYDMLGEAALTAKDANKYFQAYKQAIQDLSVISKNQDIHSSPSISVKLSALHPRYKFSQKHRVIKELTPRVLELAKLCKEAKIALTIDAEEADVLELSLDIITLVAQDPVLKDWNGFGIAIQAYQKRALHIVDWVIDLAKETHKKLNVRLVKGAYWDTEIKRAQERGLDSYPVFTHKFYTDLSYLVCAKKLLENRDIVFPQFATHNAYTVLSILELSENPQGYEFQRLHGMGEQLYEKLRENTLEMPACRIYAPVGNYDDLLPYLVRRILENGANTSFVHHLIDPAIPAEQLASNPVALSRTAAGTPHPKIPLPAKIYGTERQNSHGLDLSDESELKPLYDTFKQNMTWQTGPIIGGKQISTGQQISLFSPADKNDAIGVCMLARTEDVEKAYDIAEAAFEDWAHTQASHRADCLLKYADLLERHRFQLMNLCSREAGKTIDDALAEVREAVDFCRYYALQGKKDFSGPITLSGPTGEYNQISMHGRGIFVCISPWNFPLAIFTGQVTAALMAGNCVIAKPAGSTPLIASYAIKLMHEAGIPPEVLHFVPGASKDISAALLDDARLAGVAMTGSVETSYAINRALAKKAGPIGPFIAETGGQNAMFVDSSALPEQVVKDVLSSAFQSAGQRCSALRILFIQEDIADKVIDMLAGAMDELKIGNPAHLSTDVGPVIDTNAQSMLEEHVRLLERKAKLICRSPLSSECDNGIFVAPVAYELEDLSILTGEKFGPILHVVRYKADDLDQIIQQMNSLRFGLTLGIHSRIEKIYQHIFEHMKVGNTYVNRNMIGAVVGVQPFGGEGLSGTGPKTGGPRYLHRFAVERTLSVNTTAQGGNASLMSLMDEI